MKNIFEKVVFLFFILTVLFFIKYDGFFISGLSVVLKKFSEFSFIIKKEFDHARNSASEYFSVIDKNKELKKENEELKREILSCRNSGIFEQDVRETYKRLKKIYSNFDIQNRIVSGVLIKGCSKKYIFIPDGQVEIGDLVISNQSVIGRVKYVNDSYCIVIAVNHKDFKVKAMSLISKKEGILSVNSDGDCVFCPKILDDDFSVGEEITVVMDDNTYVSVGVIKLKLSNGFYLVDLVSNYSSVGIVVKGNAADKT